RGSKGSTQARTSTTVIRENADVRESPWIVFGRNRSKLRGARQLPSGIHASRAHQCGLQPGLCTQQKEVEVPHDSVAFEISLDGTVSEPVRVLPAEAMRRCLVRHRLWLAPG